MVQQGIESVKKLPSLRDGSFFLIMETVAKPSVRSALRVRKDRQVARPLDRRRQCSLMCRASAGNSAGQDLAALRDVLAELRRILVVDLVIFAAENTDLLFSVEAASLLERGIFSVKSHFQSPPVKTAQSDYVKGSSSSMPSGMFMNPSIEAEFWLCGACCGAWADGAALCCP